MVLACGIPMHVAVGTASTLTAATALMGFWGHALQGDFDPALALPLAIITIAKEFEPLKKDTIMLKKLFGLTALVTVFLFVSVAYAQNFSLVPEKGKVTMVDLGAHKCISCKMMAPIIKKLKKAYEGKAEVVFIDVWENRNQAPRFKIRSIPTQIFFNENGEEVYRHEGFLEEDAIVEQLAKMGVEKPDLETKG